MRHLAPIAIDVFVGGQYHGALSAQIPTISGR